MLWGQVSNRVHAAANRVTTRKNKAEPITVKDVNQYARRLAAELLGTFILTWAHAGLALSLANTAITLEASPDSRMSIAADGFASGLVLTGLIYGLGHVSGAHFNPSISFIFLILGEMNPVSFLLYVAVQVAGGFWAAGILDAVFINDAAHGNLGANQPSGGFTVVSAFWMEFIGSVLFQLAVVGTAIRGKRMGSHAALAGGLSIGAAIAYMAPYGGGSFNPARSIGPGVLASDPTAHSSTWIYVASPMGAALCTGIFLRWLTPKCEMEHDDDYSTKPYRGSAETVDRQHQNQNQYRETKEMTSA